MRCDEARKRLYPTYRFRNGSALHGADSAEAEAHLASCPDCQAFFHSERRLAEWVRAKAPREPASASLRERVLAGIRAERRRVDAAGERSIWHPAALKRRRILASGAAVILLMALWFAGVWSTDPGAGDYLVAANLVQDHVAHQSVELDVLSSDSDVIQGWFRQRVEFAFELPRAAEPVLLGGRICLVGGRQAALVVYEFPEGRGSLFIFDGRDVELPPEQMISLDGRDCLIASAQGYNVVVWKNRGLLYGLVSNTDSRELLQLAALF